MSASNSLETAILGLIFNATAWADMAQDDTSSPATNLYVALHTADPGEGGVQSTSETNYGSYARVAVARTAGGWTVTGDTVTNVAAVTFAACTSGTATITHFSIGTTSSGATPILFSGELGIPVSIVAGVTPIFAAGELDVTAD